MKFYLAKKTCQGEMFYLQEKRFFTKVYFAKKHLRRADQSKKLPWVGNDLNC